jgi:hypothetical protein
VALYGNKSLPNNRSVKLKYSLIKPYPGVYHCVIKDLYDLCMTFCRVQEFYESPYKQIKGKRFTLVELMKVYSKDRGSFTYPIDWVGFNVPGSIVSNLYDYEITDFNIYDNIVTTIHDKIVNEIGSNNYYLIGSDDNKKTIEHELCHAFYFLDGAYKQQINEILIKLSTSAYKKMTRVLTDTGYCRDVFLDELQAYLITGSALIDNNIKLTKRETENKASIVRELKHFYKNYKKTIDSK